MLTSSVLVGSLPCSAFMTGEPNLQEEGHWAQSWAHGIGWAHPMPYYLVTVIGSEKGGGAMGFKRGLSESSLGSVRGLGERFYSH